MRKASTYRGARRNAARAQGGGLQKWRMFGENADAANQKAKIGERQVMANQANKAVSLALVEAGPLAGFSVANATYLKFYRAQPQSRVVHRIIKGLTANARRIAI